MTTTHDLASYCTNLLGILKSYINFLMTLIGQTKLLYDLKLETLFVLYC